MKKLKAEFNIPEINTWKELLTKELKTSNGDDPLRYTDEIEELTFHGSYERKQHHKITKKQNWKIGVHLIVDCCNQANKKALSLLNQGADTLNFDITNTTELNINQLLESIEINYISLYFTVRDKQQEKEVNEWFKTKKTLFLHISTSEESVDAYKIHALGGNATQELAFALSKGKSLIEQNKDTPIHFTFGIGTVFLLEIAKFRAFHILWDKITTHLNFHHNSYITAQTGFVTKSLKDPYTNLLRQTTESFSAVLGGIDQLIVQPYDSLSQHGSSVFTERMSINISLILKEESEINQLEDPFSGSLAIENHTHILCDAVWKLVQKIESFGGSTSSKTESFLKTEIERIREKRVSNIQTKKQTFIGINSYLNPENSALCWKSETKEYLGLKNLILENNFNALKNKIASTDK